MLTTDEEIRDRLEEILQAAADDLGEPVRIKKRWEFSLKGKEWLSTLRSITTDTKINGWHLTRIKRKSQSKQGNRTELEFTYALFYFRSYEKGFGEDSEIKLNRLIDRTAEEFEQVTDLDHEELQVENMDTVDLKVHIAQCFLTVHVLRQG